MLALYKCEPEQLASYLALFERLPFSWFVVPVHAWISAVERMRAHYRRQFAELEDGEEYTDAAPVDQWGNPGGIFTRSWAISDPLGNDTARQIDITVSWTRRGHQRNIVMSTITRGRGT